jgi:hypothetical protein
MVSRDAHAEPDRSGLALTTQHEKLHNAISPLVFEIVNSVSAHGPAPARPSASHDTAAVAGDGRALGSHVRRHRIYGD